jgi:hypothetical protein
MHRPRTVEATFLPGSGFELSISAERHRADRPSRPELFDNPLPAGVHSATWDGGDELGRRTASGTYFVHLETGEGSRTRKIVLLNSE